MHTGRKCLEKANCAAFNVHPRRYIASQERCRPAVLKTWAIPTAACSSTYIALL